MGDGGDEGDNGTRVWPVNHTPGGPPTSSYLYAARRDAYALVDLTSFPYGPAGPPQQQGWKVADDHSRLAVMLTSFFFGRVGAVTPGVLKSAEPSFIITSRFSSVARPPTPPFEASLSDHKGRSDRG